MQTFIKKITTSTLHPQWVTGFTDAEGCFSVIIQITEPLKWKVRTSFEINLHLKDVNILHSIKSFFGVGSIFTKPDRNLCVYRVTKNSELLGVIIPHFSKYSLISKKGGDFLLWSKVVNMKSLKKQFSSEEFSTILTYYAAINRGASSKVTQYFPNIEVADKPNIELPVTLDPNWVTGFVDGDGGFIITIRKSNRVEFRFHVAQHSKDYDLLKLFINFFNSGNVYTRSNLSSPRCDFVVQNSKDVINNVVTHFDKYTLKTIKLLDYNDFRQALFIFESKKILNPEDLDKIRELKTGMNKGRID